MKKFFNSRVINNLEDFKRDSDVIIVNRLDDNIKDVKKNLHKRYIYKGINITNGQNESEEKMIQEKKSITKNYMYNLIYQVLVLISPLITIPYIARVLGAENIGIYSYTLSITAYFILFGALVMSLYAQEK